MTGTDTVPCAAPATLKYLGREITILCERPHGHPSSHHGWITNGWLYQWMDKTDEA